jgi:endonuclease/exonuclease/phosphatase (EEP) superfamily protein YafD
MLRKIYQTLAKCWKLGWLLGPLLGLIAYCPLFLFMLIGSWLPHLLVLCLACTLLLLWKQRHFAGGWLLGWILLSSWVLVPQESPQQALAEGGPVLRAAQLNVLMFNGRHERVAQEVLALEADVLAFQEVDQQWADRLVDALSADYPYFSLVPQSNCYGMALFSKRALEGVQLRLLEGYPLISARIREGGQDTLIISLHAASPMTRQRYQSRNKQLQAVAGLIQESGLPALVIGDLNTVPWDPALRPLLQEAGLRDSRSRHYTATWPSPLGRWGIPIDYVLHSAQWQTLSHRSFSIPGSDHKGLVAELHYRNSLCASR